MDMLQQIFDRQAQLMARYGTPTILDVDSPKDILKTVDYNAGCLSQEAAEIRDWTPWKKWSKQIGSKDPNWPPELHGTPAHIKEIALEYIDALHFVAEGLLILGFSAEDAYKLYCEKNQINHDRQDTGTY